MFHDPLDRSPHCSGRTAALALLSRLGGAGESGTQCLEHSFDFVNALADYYETLWWIHAPLGLATALPFDLRSSDLSAHRGDLAAQDLCEEFGLDTFGRLCQRHNPGDGVGVRRPSTVVGAGIHRSVSPKIRGPHLQASQPRPIVA